MAFHQIKKTEDHKPVQQDRRSGEVCYNKKGEPDSHSRTFAKLVQYDLGDKSKERYFVATYLGSLYDPNGGYSNRESRLNIEFKSVSAATFHSYVDYLQTRKEIHFTKANRSFINGN